MSFSLEKLRSDYKAYRKSNPDIANKLDILLSITKIELELSGTDLVEAKQQKLKVFLTAIKLSERTLQRWKKAYAETGADGLGKKIASGRPPGQLPNHIKKLINKYRKKFKWGSEVIQAHLREDHQYATSRHKIERYLETSGLRALYPCTTIKKQKAQKDKKHTRKVKVNNPGAHTQMDVKYQLHLLLNKQKAYVYNFIDHASNWSFKRAYPAINERNTLDFMIKLHKKCPFYIFRLQTDNGIEFTFKYVSGAPDEPKEHLLDKFCNENNIAHKLIPPGEKELQGLVERSHRQDDQELFSRITPKELDEFNKKLEQYTKGRNQKRRFKKLGWKTPDQWLKDYLVIHLAFILSKVDSQKFGEAEILRVSAEATIIDLKKKHVEDERAENGAIVRKLAA
jgi:transposase